jgi:DNA polymerase-3 subunit delta'
VIGHENILKFFEEAEKVSLSHAYGFIGPGGVGKRTAAMQIGSRLLKTSPEKIMQHPDFILVERIEDEKSGKLKKEITVTQARDLRDRLQRTSWNNGYRVVIINDAELLNLESGNALLKLLEEPPQRTIFFLLVENEASLLVTIRSRLQLFYFSLVPVSKVADGLRGLGVESVKADIVARRSLGRPGRAITLLESEKSERYDELLMMFQQLVGAPFYKKIQIVEKLYGDKEDGERGRREWQEILDAWIGWFRDWLLKKHGATQYASEPSLFTSVNFSDKELVRIIDGFVKVKRMLQQNVHPRLAIEEALLHI